MRQCAFDQMLAKLHAAPQVRLLRKARVRTDKADRNLKSRFKLMKGHATAAGIYHNHYPPALKEQLRVEWSWFTSGREGVKAKGTDHFHDLCLFDAEFFQHHCRRHRSLAHNAKAAGE